MSATDTSSFFLAKNLKFTPIPDLGQESMTSMEKYISRTCKNQEKLSPDKIIKKNKTHNKY
jgi:hypothetical protein